MNILFLTQFLENFFDLLIFLYLFGDSFSILLQNLYHLLRKRLVEVFKNLRSYGVPGSADGLPQCIAGFIGFSTSINHFTDDSPQVFDWQKVWR